MAIPGGGDLGEVAAFLAGEDLLGKLRLVQELEARERYRADQPDLGYVQRVKRAAGHLPDQQKLGFLALAASVVYIPRSLKMEALKQIARDAATECSNRGIDVPGQVHIFTDDHPGLVDDLFRVGGEFGWTGRLDLIEQRDIRSTSALLEALDCIRESDSRRADNLRQVFGSKRAWMLLTDNSLSGGSAVSDLHRLQAVAETFSNDGANPVIYCAAEVLTKQARNRILGEPLDNGALEGEEDEGGIADRVLYGILFDDSFRIGSDDCQLFSEPSTLQKVREFCEWFGQEMFEEMGEEHPFYSTLEIHQGKDGVEQDFRYGWADGGYTIIRQENAPTNTVPPLWYPYLSPFEEEGSGEDQEGELSDYEPPLPRNHSRYKQKTSEDDEVLGRITGRADKINELLWGDQDS